MADYSSGPTRQGTDFELIPDGVLAKGWLTVEPYQGGAITPPKDGKENSYLKCKITITEGPFERRIVFTNIMRGPGEKALNMGNAQLRAILEYGNNAGPHNPKGYVLPGDDGEEFMPWTQDGIPVAIKVKAKYATDEEKKKGWKDKNEVALFLSPNPESDGHKDFLRLQKGDTGPTKPAAAPAQGTSAPPWSKPAAPAAAQPKVAVPHTPAAPAKPPWMAGGR